MTGERTQTRGVEAKRSGAGPVRVVLAALAALIPVLSGCASATAGAAGSFPQLSPYQGREIEAVHFLSPAPFTRDTLLRLVQTQATHCSLLGLPICIPGTGIGKQEHTVDMGTLASDVVRLAVFYRQNGYFGTEVRPGVQPKGGKVEVTFAIMRGDAVALDSLAVNGTSGILNGDSLARTLPLKPGGRFDLTEFMASADTVESAVRARGYAYAEVLRNYTVDTLQDRATASLDVVPGPQVRVDSIIVVGAPHLGRKAVLRQLEFKPGDLLRPRTLLESQRNLYSLDIVQFATVAVAPDSMQISPSDSTRATVEVRIAEAPLHVVEGAIGYGSIECFRAHASWATRSLAGGGRRLALQAQVSKIGLGAPTTSQAIATSICKAYGDDPFRNQLDYHVSADLTQPYFLAVHNQLVMSVFGDRTSEPGLFQRTANGGRLSVLRSFHTQDVLSLGVDVERGQTTASPAIFCLALLVCQPSEIAQLSRFRWRNSFGLSFVRDRSNDPLNPTRGYRLRSGITWATKALASDTRFVRWTGEASIYHALQPKWILAAYLRLGTFLGSASVTSEFGSTGFLPPEERFFAGGATSVRGYDRNALGPGVYVSRVASVDSAGNLIAAPDSGVQFVPVGGTSVAVASTELRVPSPILSDYLRLAMFVDAGAVGTQELWNLGPSSWRVTPGFGFRVATPVGPVRLDIAYNPYGTPDGPLFVTDQATGALIRVRAHYHQSRASFFSHLKIHVAVGQPF